MTDPQAAAPLIRAILFDLDGTLIDTERAAERALDECMRGWGLNPDPRDAEFITGRTWESAFQFLFSKYEIPIPGPQAKREILTRYRAAVESDPQWVPGAAEAVRALATEYRLALVSGSFRHEILWALEKLGVREHFEVVLGAEDYPRSKPAPDGFLKAMDLLGMMPSECLVFEDSQAGVKSGRDAGAFVAVIESTNHFAQDTSLAHWRIPDLRGVSPSWVRSLARPESV